MRQLFVNQVRWTSELDVYVNWMASVLVSDEEEVEESDFSLTSKGEGNAGCVDQ